MLKKVSAILWMLLLIQSSANFAATLSLRNDLNNTIQPKTTTDVGKSFVVNKTKETLRIDYNLCDFDYNHKTEMKSNISCTSFNQNLESNQSIDFDLVKLAITSEIYHYRMVFLYKITDSSGHYQYFIKDYNDSKAYRDYINNFRTGVQKVAAYCTLFYEQTKTIYPTRTSFLCV